MVRLGRHPAFNNLPKPRDTSIKIEVPLDGSAAP